MLNELAVAPPSSSHVQWFAPFLQRSRAFQAAAVAGSIALFGVAGLGAAAATGGGPEPVREFFGLSSSTAHAELEGIVVSVEPGANTLQVSAGGGIHTVVVNSATRFSRGGDAITLADVAAGNAVEVRGQLQPDHSILAERIHIEDGDHGNNSGPGNAVDPTPDDGSNSDPGNGDDRDNDQDDDSNGPDNNDGRRDDDDEGDDDEGDDDDSGPSDGSGPGDDDDDDDDDGNDDASPGSGAGSGPDDDDDGDDDNSGPGSGNGGADDDDDDSRPGNDHGGDGDDEDDDSGPGSGSGDNDDDEDEDEEGDDD
jgi:hypothetical protein